MSVSSARRVEAIALQASYPDRTRKGRRSPHERRALRGVDLRVDAGEIVAVIGQNGSGKTTLLQVFAGVLSPVGGTVHTWGRVSTLIDLTAGMHRELTGRENAMTAGVLAGMRRAEVTAAMDDILGFTGIDLDALDSPLFTYSSGMGLRLGFSVAVYTEPDVLLVDEVLAVGDAAFQEQCLARVHELADAGTAVIVATHDLDLVRGHADRAVLLERGRIVGEGAPDLVVDDYLARALAQGTEVPTQRQRRRSARARNRLRRR
jgi:lipopolysaccharide transport system ATP-binding protein